ncbi:hypothetical protein Agabi119p4_10632 [Agaricus bisporus var. burnettii]|uniref:Uncharacterized protein n=1 Tax=Agaricus bisporus var. burnettii TaxID=192524 RepID=A0A8H7C384_AGABI|nr:hypothetical protein Agabi119p4_10632 [Agaricus bisporus var. burnettii]
MLGLVYSYGRPDIDVGTAAQTANQRTDRNCYIHQLHYLTFFLLTITSIERQSSNLLIGGYKCTPEEIYNWFHAHGVELRQYSYAARGNRYLRDHQFQSRIRSCDYEGKHCFVVLTHQKFIGDFDALQGKYERFEEDDYALAIKDEMGLQDVEFVTHAVRLD